MKVQVNAIMYENYTRQSLPERKYRELLGSAICVFNSNNSFIIENILNDTNLEATWYELVDKESGQLKSYLDKRIQNEGQLGEKIYLLFSELVDMRNRIIHSFQITAKDGRQILATKTRINDGNKQFIITEDYLYNFIAKNEALSILLYELRGY